jgi:DNA (cytosine-5)-methyltransferase 1
MVYQFLRFVRKLKPEAVMLENVPALANNWRLRDLKRELRKLGYIVDAKILDAADFGVPQRRRRLILLASKGDKPRFASPRKKRRTVRQTIEHLAVPGATGDPCHDIRERRKPHVLELIKKIPKDGGSRRALGDEGQLPCHQEFDGFKDVYGRMAWDSVAPTITGGCVNPSKGRFLHPEQDRSITLREAALLQGFPRSYMFSLERGKFPAAEMIGNAFPPGFVAPHARKLRKRLQQYEDDR